MREFLPRKTNSSTRQPKPPPGQALAIPTPMTNREIRSTFLILAKYLTTQEQVVATQDQAMSIQANREVGPQVQQNSSTTASHLRDFTRMNPHMLYRSKVNELPQILHYEFFKIHYSISLTPNEKAGLGFYQFKDGIPNRETIGI